MPATPRQPVSGRYRARTKRFEVELRIDVDGPRATGRVSADYYRDGRYHGSMRVDATTIAFASDTTTITGRGAFTWDSSHTTVRIAVHRVGANDPRAPAALSHFTAAGMPGRAYRCAFEAPELRRVELQEAFQTGIEPVADYDTGVLASGPPRRTLSYVRAYAEAGIEMARSQPATHVDTGVAGRDATWNDAELQAAMQQHFTRLGDKPRWAVWMLHAGRHDNPQLLGLMFDRRGAERQGCAIFYGRMPGSTADRRRTQLHTCVHELGHSFNLLHCWQRSLATPPIPARPAASTWMNYPGYFPGGERAYWPQFAFRFDDPEIVHLRHGFLHDVIMGGRPFMAARATDRAAQTGAGGLRLQLRTLETIALGMPVTCELTLSAGAERDHVVPAALGPRAGTVDISIRTPAGTERVFEPLLLHCRGDEHLTLRAKGAPLRDTAFIHHGKRGLMFERPGLYETRARYTTADGTAVLSNVAAIRVLAPATRADRAVAELVAGNEEVGAQMSLIGSRAPELRAGDETLQLVIDRFPNHPFAAIARLVRGTAVGREFKNVDATGSLVVMAPEVAAARALFAPVIDSNLRLLRGDPAVAGFLNSRKTEIAAAARTVLGGEPSPDSPGRPAPTRRPPFDPKTMSPDEPDRVPIDHGTEKCETDVGHGSRAPEAEPPPSGA